MPLFGFNYPFNANTDPNLEHSIDYKIKQSNNKKKSVRDDYLRTIRH
jgi:hypothetical protein